MIPLSSEKIILGCGNFGGVGSLPTLIGKGDSPEQAVNILNLAIHHGIFQFDTANSYSGGHSEEILGHWISSLEPYKKDKICISTKVGNPYATTAGMRPLCAQEILFHLHKSLKRLQIQQIHTYYLHQPDPTTPLEETLSALEAAIQEGDIKYIGLSNVDLPYVESFLKSCSLHPAQKALQFVLETKGIQAAVIGMRRKEHFENLGFIRH